MRGSPLIPSQDGAHRKQKLERQASGGDDKIPFPSGETNTFGRHLVGGAHAKNRKITPSLVNKYVTTGKVYGSGED